ncbi:DUF833-domain-containing protein [Atractiella rhizophila]|nr:DUF833-domain-containing protein [Atractiella rhizophila]
MCIIFWSTSHPKYSLILIANRDEFLARPALPASLHNFSTTSSDPPSSRPILSGIDVQASGTWIGVNLSTLHFGALTNFTENVETIQGRPSRGDFVKNWLSDGGTSVEAWLSDVEERKEPYAGFNFLFGTLNPLKLAYVTNRSGKGGRVLVQEGEMGLTNNTLDDPKCWQKTEIGLAAFKRVLEDEKEDKELIKELWEVISQPSIKGSTNREEIRQTVLVPPMPFPDPYGTYATKVQTMILLERMETKEGKRRLVFIERDGFVLDEDGNANWSGEERNFEVEVPILTA